MGEHFEAIVVGAGMGGSAAAYQLCKDGRRTLLLEQFKIGHDRGSSHGESRIFRFAYPQAHYAKFAMQSKPLWLDLERDSGEKLLHSIGGLDFADEPDCFKEVHAIAAALRQNGATCELLEAREIRRRYPQWRIPDQTIGAFSPDGGWIAATKALQAMARQVQRLGGSVLEEEPVKQIRITNHKVEVTTAKGEYAAEMLVIAAGAWLKPLLLDREAIAADQIFSASLQRLLELPLKVTQEQPVYFAPIRNAETFREDRFPIWIHYRKPFFTYGFPMLEKPGVKWRFITMDRRSIRGIPIARRIPKWACDCANIWNCICRTQRAR